MTLYHDHLRTIHRDQPLNVIITFRILSSFQMTSGDPFAAIEQSIATYADVYKAICAGEQVTCAIKGTVFDAISAPSVIVMDVCLFFLHSTPDYIYLTYFGWYLIIIVLHIRANDHNAIDQWEHYTNNGVVDWWCRCYSSLIRA